jgi:tryptophanyl-tRNA synthetase
VNRVLTGVTPSGSLTLGNYFGAIHNLVRLQDQAECLLAVVDLHALTVPQDPKQLAALTLETAGLFLACGVNPKVTSVFIQSQVEAHCELAWLLGCMAPFGSLLRMTQFKARARRGRYVSTGLFTYPVLMAADILLYNTDVVPIGEDQKQHLEFTRDVARRADSRFGPVFKVPEALIPERRSGGRLMRLDDPSRKMSKSEDPAGSILLLDPPEAIVRKIRSAVTDSGSAVRYDERDKPAVSNLMVIYSLCAGEPLERVEEQFRMQGYADLKHALTEAVIGFLDPIQYRYAELQDSGQVEQALAAGRERAAQIAETTLNRVKQAFGLLSARSHGSTGN